MKTTVELTQETNCEEERMLSIRRRIWRGEGVEPRVLVEGGMLVADYLCKLSSRIDRERNAERVVWLQQTRRSLRAQLRQYWVDALEQRADIRPADGEMARAS